MYPKSNSTTILSGILLSISVSAVATLQPASAASVFCLDGFQGNCAPENWTITTEGDSSVTFIGSDGEAAILISSDSALATQDFTPKNTFLEIKAPKRGIVSFSYNYQTFDRDGASFDPFGYFSTRFGEITVVPPPFLSEGESIRGSRAFNVAAGDTFGFYARATDNQLGPSVTTVSNFTYDVPGPLPILGVGAALGYSRKLRNRIKSSNEAFDPIASS